MIRSPDRATGSGWRKSSYSRGNGGACVVVAAGLPGAVPVRDSKNPEGPHLVFPGSAWSTFISGVKTGRPSL
ncbi:DUF397 domain-containing protein [Streptomyces zingiberis]|uniref:DUF397 domain-containing protein n=1 Tax=Streptomyces zingiberis TaxID=2053010 RepID=A0ABX1BVD5_9ACTN|nr:DUF397 domain-containing protein [Streptomyces zingiberis]NJQ00500.1 DUF397 domain-containing protein [Streptomyces zingiberis]